MDGHLLKKIVFFFICCLKLPQIAHLNRPYSKFWTATFQILAKSLQTRKSNFRDKKNPGISVIDIYLIEFAY